MALDNLKEFLWYIYYEMVTKSAIYDCLFSLYFWTADEIFDNVRSNTKHIGVNKQENEFVIARDSLHVKEGWVVRDF